MNSNLYKEISYKIQGFRLVSWLIAAISLLLCLLIGIGFYILVIGMNGKNSSQEIPIKNERINIVEGEIKEPLWQKAMQYSDDKDKISSKYDTEDVVPLAHLQQANKFLRKSTQDAERTKLINKPDIHPHSYKTSFSMRYPMMSKAGFQPTLRDVPVSLEQTLRSFDRIAAQFAEAIKRNEQNKEGINRRLKRSLPSGVFSLIPYVSYAFFGKFLLNQVSEIAEYNVESRAFKSRKLGGDPEVNLLDGIWPLPISNTNKKTVKKASADLTDAKTTTEIPREKWQPLVNQVPLNFVAEILRTLLNLMKEFLMKDHVMECLWYMFCQDVNHQAKYSDIYGILARINR